MPQGDSRFVLVALSSEAKQFSKASKNTIKEGEKKKNPQRERPYNWARRTSSSLISPLVVLQQFLLDKNRANDEWREHMGFFFPIGSIAVTTDFVWLELFVVAYARLISRPGVESRDEKFWRFCSRPVRGSRTQSPGKGFSTRIKKIWKKISKNCNPRDTNLRHLGKFSENP